MRAKNLNLGPIPDDGRLDALAVRLPLVLRVALIEDLPTDDLARHE